MFHTKTQSDDNQAKLIKLNKTESGGGRAADGVGLTGDTYVFCQRWVLSRWTRLPGELVPQTLVLGGARRRRPAAASASAAAAAAAATAVLRRPRLFDSTGSSI